jgi:hypothetical protein
VVELRIAGVYGERIYGMNKVCPMCGGTELYGKAGGILANGWQLVMKATRIAWFGSQGPIRLDGMICARCGYVALQVPMNEMDRLPAELERGGWTRL